MVTKLDSAIDNALQLENKTPEEINNATKNILDSYQEQLLYGQILDVNDLPKFEVRNYLNNNTFKNFDGDKFFGGFGDTKIFTTDYWTLRQRSKQLFKENLYARGLIRRLITNEINTGLTLEATPNGAILGLEDDELNAWSENVENRFTIWGNNPELCDFKQKDTFGQLQQNIRSTALIEGDVLVILVQSKKTGLPAVRLIPGGRVRTPLDAVPRAGNKIVHGVELDKNGIQVAYWIDDGEFSSKRIPAKGEKSGRKLAWLVYGTDSLLDEVRGEPILSLILQSLKEIDRYRDSAQRKAVVNSILAMFIEKGENKMGTRPMTGGAVRRDTVTATDPDGSTRNFNLSEQIPGVVFEELQHGEKPVGFNSTGTDINFPIFESAVINAIAWANEIPPEVLQLAFGSNYAASRSAVSELKMYLNKIRFNFSNQLNQPIYEQWLLAETFNQKIEAPGLVEAWRDFNLYDIYGAWVLTDWAGAIKPSTDLKKDVSAYSEEVKEGFITRERVSKELNGMKFSRIMKRLKEENALLAESMRPILELQKEFKIDLSGGISNLSAGQNLMSKFMEAIEDSRGEAE